MNVINFYNGDRQHEMSFSEFRFEINEPHFPNYVLFQIDVKHSFILASINTECLEIDFINFLADLRNLYRMKEVKTISFVQTIEKNIVIDFNLTELGYILVRVTIQKQIDSTTLQFEYGMDQSFLPELISEIENMLNDIA